VSKNDQIKVILKNIGRQHEDCLSYVSTEHAVSYVRDLEKASIKNPTDEPFLDKAIGKLRPKVQKT